METNKNRIKRYRLNKKRIGDVSGNFEKFFIIREAFEKTFFLAAGIKSIQTLKESLRDPTRHAFTITLPNLIHQLKRRDLKRK